MIPDGYASTSIVQSLEQHCPVPNLYHGLDFIHTMDPSGLIPKDDRQFEDFGFSVLSPFTLGSNL